MHEITSENAAEYLRRMGHAGLTEPVEVCELPGGVSNLVLRIDLPSRGETFILKQARQRLRVTSEWLCPVERIGQEVETLRAYHKIIAAQRHETPSAVVPQFLWEDQVNYAFAMTAAPLGHHNWKHLLLAGDIESGQSIAVDCARLLARLHAGSWHDRDLPDALYDRTYFVQLRLDPYYRQVARRHPDLAPAIEQLIDCVWQNRRCLVHGDFSPKNLLVWPEHIMLIDFEVGHYGDPAFDLGFFLTHLVLKSLWADERRQAYLDLATEFWRAYQTTLAAAMKNEHLAPIAERTNVNLAGGIIARMEGKSPVDYLSASQQEKVRRLAWQWIIGPPLAWNSAISELSMA